ncbi:Pentalenic acid synthase [Shewanella sp. P1-14-1]|uniref:cytochrome P450 n=1 Tax=Shewanella sp. P1-14-1 TaxID=1723761 RepID=UPI0006D687D9|nr:cytochrome P450 [Shewanella sp. P1-14-1]KPZ72861.1 Pentalenic acid synthase [Shewanella sp. P1-14-1]
MNNNRPINRCPINPTDQLPDVFEQARITKGLGFIEDQDDPVTMILGLKDVRKCAHNWKIFQSGAVPGRIVVPSEVSIRETRQIPFELDPPEHKQFRDLLNPWFKRPLEQGYINSLQQIIAELVDDVIHNGSTDIVSEFSLKLQSRALTLLLNVPYEESLVWINWGTHVFRSNESELDGEKAAILYDYIDNQIELAIKMPSDSLYSSLLSACIDGKKLSKEQIKGVMILTFAGGRDTVINAVTNTIAYFASQPSSLSRLRKEPEIIPRAVEELIRYFSPLTHMGRVVTQDTDVAQQGVTADSRISLCWASANRDASVFEQPNEVILDRKINPHVAFGFGTHNCLGATHARQIIKTLITTLTNKVDTIEVLSQQDNIEDWGAFQRKVGYEQLNAIFSPYR